MAARSSALYRAAGVALLRASTDPGGLDLPDDLDLFGEDTAQQGLAWLSATWQRDDVRSAVRNASPALSQQIDHLVAGGNRDARTVRRAVISVASYALRWQRRPTPFGLFAGVGLARFGAGAGVRWGREHRVVARADAGWLGDVVHRLHQSPELRERLSVVVNDGGNARGDRFVAPGLAADGDAHALAPIEVSVRNSRPVRAALAAAGEPVRFGELRARLMDQFPGAAAPQIDGMLAGLLEQGILISSLRAPMTALDALGHTCAELEAAAARDIPDIGGVVCELSAIHRAFCAGGSAGVAPGPAVTERMTALSAAADVPLIVDTVVDCDVEIPEQVAQAACDAVRALYRLSPYPLGYPAWRDYHSRFRASYGTGALVPVLELVADSGLGFPADYLGSPRGRAARQVSERDERLLALIQRATLDGGEIVLTDQMIDDLATSDPADVHLPSRVEVAVEIRSDSVEALARGRFSLAVTGTPRPGSSMAGRHAHLLAKEGRDMIADTFTATESDAVAAQLSFAPRKRRNENVARTGQLLAHVIPVAEHNEPGEHMISLADLAVTVDERRFYLIQLSTGRRVEPRVTHALEAGVHTPPLARFLAEITTARSAVYKAFHFGAAARLPYLPRIRYRRTTLSPARWALGVGELPGRGASMSAWEIGLDAWRARWHVPEHVAIVEHDRRQPVDLGHRLHRLLLRTRLERGGRLELRETATPEDVAWLGRAHEVLIPLVLAAPAVAGQPLSITRQRPGGGGGARHLPGNSSVVCAQIHGHPGRFDEILTERLPDLINAFGDAAPQWWFRRNREMRRPEIDQYLAVYLRLPDSSAYGAAAQLVAAWSDRLRRERLLSTLTLATHEFQPGRYGHGPAWDRAQDVFAADSAAAIAQITTALAGGVHTQALAAASLVDLVVSFAGSAPAGLHWLASALPREQGRLEPALRNQALKLADPDGPGPVVRSLHGGETVAAAWRSRAVALAAYREDLAGQRDPLTVLQSLLHLHHSRAVGVDPAVERVTGRLARACALRHTARRGRTE